MPIINWTDKFLTGINTIDEQHKTLVDNLNKFYDKIASGNSMEGELQNLLDETINYTNYHFIEEEKFMKQINFSEMDSHKLKHDELIKKMRDFSEKLKNGKVVLSVSITSALKTWIKEHILVEDMKYAQFYKNVK